MSDLVCNIAKGRVVEYYNRVKGNDPSTSALIVIALVVTGDRDAVIKDADDVATILADGSIAEATNSGYARATLTDSDLVALPAPDDTNDRYDIAVPEITFSSIVAGDNWTDLLIAYDADTGAGTDSNLIPLTLHDFSRVPDGNDITVSAGNFFRAS